MYNNRYYYKLYLLTEKQIDIQEYFMHAKSETEILEPEVVDEEENTKEWEQENKRTKVAEILEEPQLAEASEETATGSIRRNTRAARFVGENRISKKAFM